MGNSPFIAGTGARSVVVDPAGNYVYVSNGTSGNVSIFQINQSTGNLTPTAASPQATVGTFPYGAVIDPSGHFLYVADSGTTQVDMFTKNSDGSLTSLGAVGTLATDSALNLTIPSWGKFLYTADRSANTITTFSISSGTGLLTRIGATGAGSTVWALTTDPAGNLLFSANQVSSNVSAYTISHTTGALNQVANSPFGTGGVNPQTIAVDPTGQFLFVANAAGSIAVFSIIPGTGQLTALAGSPYTIAGSPQGLLFVTIPQSW